MSIQFKCYVTVLLIGAVAILLYLKNPLEKDTPSNTANKDSESPTGLKSNGSAIGSNDKTIEKPVIYHQLENNPLRDYGQGSPVNDLEIIHNTFEIYRTAVRNKVRRFPNASSNTALVSELTGNNIEHLQIILPESPYINSTGEIIDRWGTPLSFHFVSDQSIGIRSAGPDKNFFTKDDLHRPAEEKIMFID